MALNLNDRIAVREVIVDRCTAAVVQYANYLLGLPAGDGTGGTASGPQHAWAREAIREPKAQGNRISWYVLNDPNYIADGSGITDQQLQGAVEAAINTHFIV